MHFRATVFTAILAASAAVAAPAPAPEAEPNWITDLLGNLPIYCLNDWQANNIVGSFMSILTNPNRQAANATAQGLIAPQYNEISDSINSLSNQPLGSITFAGKTNFINGVVGAPAIPGMSTLSVYHDCSHITWRWLITGLGSRVDEVKGINVFTVNTQGQLIENDLEFNSIAWGADTGYTTLFPGQPCPAQ